MVWWLETADRVRRRIDPGGVTLGRSPRCDVVLSSDRASRVHALAHLAPEGPRWVQLGRGKTRVNGQRIEGEHALRAGDSVEVPGLALTVVAEDGPTEEEGTAWVVERAGGGLFGISRAPFTIGGGAGDDLRIDGWADRALELRALAGALELRASVSVTVDGEAIEPGAPRAIERGAAIEHEGERFTIVSAVGLGEASTLHGSTQRAAGSARVVLEFLPRGGRLFVRRSGAELAVYLPDRRCDLAAVLLSPPDPARPGDFVSDELVLARVWGKEVKGRTDLNVLVHRLRKDLSRAGLDGAALVERAQGGGATRFAIDPGTAVELV